MLVAKLRPFRPVAQAVAVVGITVTSIMLLLSLIGSSGDPNAWGKSLFAALLGLAFFLPRIPFSVLIVAQIFSGNREALWIHDGTLIFLSRGYYRMGLDDIVCIELREEQHLLGQSSFAIVRARDGSNKRIPLDQFDEPPIIIISRLQKALERSGDIARI